MLKEQIYTLEIGVENPSGAEQATRAQVALAGRPSFDPVAGGVITVPGAGASYGADDVIPGAAMGTATFAVQLNGVADAGDVPDWGVILRGMSYAETISAGSDVTYSPVLTGAETLTVVGHHDSNSYKYVGSIVTSLTANFSANALPQLDVGIMSRNVSVATLAAPAQPQYRTPLPVQGGNTVLTVDGLDLCFSSAAMSFEVAHTDPTTVVCTDPDEITNIAATFTGTVKDAGFDVKNWEAKFANAFVPVQLVHGSAGGERITIASAEAKITALDKNAVIAGGVAVGLTLQFRKGALPTWKID